MSATSPACPAAGRRKAHAHAAKADGRDFEAAVPEFAFLHCFAPRIRTDSAASAAYCASLTCSIQSTALPSSASWMAIWVMAVVGAAPCQCFSPGGNQTTSPGRISSIGPPSRCTRPKPAVTISVWPSGWVCQAVRAPGSKVTLAPPTRAGSGALKQRIDAHRAGEPVRRPFAGRPRAASLDVHRSNSFQRLENARATFPNESRVGRQSAVDGPKHKRAALTRLDAISR